MKKLLFLVTLPPPVHGSNRVNQMMVENPLLNERFDTRILPLNYTQTIEEIGSFKVSKYIRLIKYLFQLLWLLLTFRPAAVYFVPCVTGGPFWRDCLFVAILKLSSAQRIFHLHGKGVKACSAGKIKTAVYRWFFREAKVLLLSSYLYADIETVVPKTQISYLPNGTDIADEGLSVEKQLVAPIRFVFLSNLIRTKGPESLLDACQILKEKGHLFSVVFIGNPSIKLTKDGFVSLIKNKGLENYVYYLGPKYGTEKNAELKTVDVMVFPTYKDCFPLVLLEGMAFGLPVISTFEGAIPDIVDDGKTGFLVLPKDPVALAEKMALLIERPDLVHHFGRNGYKKYQDQYTLSAFNQRSANLLAELIVGTDKDEESYDEFA